MNNIFKHGKKLFISLKNGKTITSYNTIAGFRYTINLQYKNDLFIIHYYVFDGNDVFDEENYKDEHIIEKAEFNDLVDLVKNKFPGSIESWDRS